MEESVFHGSRVSANGEGSPTRAANHSPHHRQYSSTCWQRPAGGRTRDEEEGTEERDGWMDQITELTLPSYSRRESTSGAMYAGVPTVDLGREWSNDDCSSIQETNAKGDLYLKIRIDLALRGEGEEVSRMDNLGVTEVADLEARRRAAIEQRVLQFQIAVADLLKTADWFSNLG
ncbi:hypothetical protein GW17_00025984 [Ensete ventricosum]|nr:hypothetical protein GW17_00025984 [Ensete ventricosum]RZR83221.1 hypothetical protein BHM03_00009810 [Ensete ventricosum]